jgi:putative endonuclease
MWEHRQHVGSRFAKLYNATKLVYFELYDEPQRAIAREKQIKSGSRAAKIALIQTVNPAWRDLFDEP